MPIQILSAQLANQIAAGEVVERPASVIKEVVENSLDAGATQIDIEIDKGGHKRMLVRDNGSGIDKDQLTLALSRHATSKISCLDDLEQIHSLGFRGEALASISSVSRLTLSSRTAEQSQGWQAQCEGRDMQVKVQPVAHPQGSSVEVLDLFFNTPARRKFLRSEKTEFNHIDELLKRIALSRFDVAFSLKHNGKVVRKLPKASNETQRFARVTKLLGKAFAERGLSLQSGYQDMQLTGWFCAPDPQQADLAQYVYVNGRMMRDKLINHAIRQAIEESGMQGPAGYVLYLTLDACQVDVNVHPAKHEVRFHQARLVHDFILRAVTDVIHQQVNVLHGDADDQQEAHSESRLSPPAVQSINQLPDPAPSHDYIQPLKPTGSYSPTGSRSRAAIGGYRTEQVSESATANYVQLMQPQVVAQSQDHISWLVLPNQQLLVQLETKHLLCRIQALLAAQLSELWPSQAPVAQPLLMPVAVTATSENIARAQALYEPLLEVGFDLGWSQHKVLLRKVPAVLRQWPWGELLDTLLQLDIEQNNAPTAAFLDWLARQSLPLPDALQLQTLGWFAEQTNEQQQRLLAKWAVAVPLSDWLADYV